jgi:hypothetical protein
MTAEIKALHGAVINTGEPCKGVIEMLEEYLEEARRGEIVGLGLAAVQGNGDVVTDWAPGRAHRHFLVAGVNLLAHKITAEVSADPAGKTG